VTEPPEGLGVIDHLLIKLQTSRQPQASREMKEDPVTRVFRVLLIAIVLMLLFVVTAGYVFWR